MLQQPQESLTSSAGPAEIIISESFNAETYSFCFSDLGISDFFGVFIIYSTFLLNLFYLS